MRKFTTYILNNSLAIVEILLLVRIIFRALSANPAASIVALIYGVSDWLMSPVNYIFPNIPLFGNAVVDVVALSAMLFYFVIYTLIVKILRASHALD